MAGKKIKTTAPTAPPSKAAKSKGMDKESTEGTSQSGGNKHTTREEKFQIIDWLKTGNNFKARSTLGS